jgi:hypothetical protein
MDEHRIMIKLRELRSDAGEDVAGRREFDHELKNVLVIHAASALNLECVDLIVLRNFFHCF